MLISLLDSLNVDFAQNFLKLLKSEGVTGSHGSPLSLALSNKLLDVHFLEMSESAEIPGRLFCTMLTMESIIIDIAIGTEETDD